MIIVLFFYLQEDGPGDYVTKHPAAGMPPAQSLQSSGLTLSETNMGRCVQGQRRVCSRFYQFNNILLLLHCGAFIEPQKLLLIVHTHTLVNIFTMQCSVQKQIPLVASPQTVFFSSPGRSASLQVRPRRVTTAAWMLDSDGNCLTQISAGCLTGIMKIKGMKRFIRVRENQ